MIPNRRSIPTAIFYRRNPPDELHGTTTAATIRGGVTLLFTNELTRPSDPDHQKFRIEVDPRYADPAAVGHLEAVEFHYDIREVAAYADGVAEGEFDDVLRPRRVEDDERIALFAFEHNLPLDRVNMWETSALGDTKDLSVHVTLLNQELADVSLLFGTTLEFPDPRVAQMNIADELLGRGITEGDR